jgi:FkbM family methyltransferase
MKVALVLTGHMRCWEFLFPKFKKDFIDKYNPDIFISTWDNEGWWRRNSEKGFDNSSPSINEDAIRHLYKPVKMVVENFDDYDKQFTELAKQFPNYLINAKNIISMFYKIKSGINLLKEFAEAFDQEYDLVIRCRPDIYLEGQLPEFDSKNFYSTIHRNHKNNGTGDTFHAGSYDDMLEFADLFDNLHKVYEISGLLCPHVLTLTWIQALGLSHVEIPNVIRLVNSRIPKFFNSPESEQSIVFDVGTNDIIGTKRFLMKKNMKVYAFEAVEEIHNWNVRLHGTDSRLIMINNAVSDVPGIYNFRLASWEKWHCNSFYEFTDNINSIWGGLYHEESPQFRHTGYTTTEAIRLDDFCKKNNISKIDYLNVDASGSDFNVLKSLGEYINLVEEGRVTAFATTQLYKGVNNNMYDIVMWLDSKGFKYNVEYDNDKYKNEAYIHFVRK